MRIKNISPLALLFCIQFIIFNSLLYVSALGSDPSGSTYVYIRSISCGKYIGTEDTSLYNGKSVKLFKRNETAKQMWYIHSYSNGWSYIRSAQNSNYYLSVAGGSGTAGATLVLSYVSSSSSIPDKCLFKIASASYGVARIKTKASYTAGTNLVLKAVTNSTSEGIEIEQNTEISNYDNGYLQLWAFEGTTRAPNALSYDLVDNNGLLEWSGTTKYQTLFNMASTRWNTEMGTTRIKKTTVSANCDVTICDQPDSATSVSYLAVTVFSPTRKIEFYTNPMDALGYNVLRAKTITHELGHALGLEHSTTGGDIMKQGALAYYISVSLNDYKSYNEAALLY